MNAKQSLLELTIRFHRIIEWTCHEILKKIGTSSHLLHKGEFFNFKLGRCLPHHGGLHIICSSKSLYHSSLGVPIHCFFISLWRYSYLFLLETALSSFVRGGNASYFLTRFQYYHLEKYPSFRSVHVISISNRSSPLFNMKI